MSSYYPDPAPPEEYTPRRMYDCLADVKNPDGTILVKAGDVFNETLREKVDQVLPTNARGYYEVPIRHIPFE